MDSNPQACMDTVVSGLKDGMVIDHDFIIQIDLVQCEWCYCKTSVEPYVNACADTQDYCSRNI